MRRAGNAVWPSDRDMCTLDHGSVGPGETGGTRLGRHRHDERGWRQANTHYIRDARDNFDGPGRPGATHVMSGIPETTSMGPGAPERPTFSSLRRNPGSRDAVAALGWHPEASHDSAARRDGRPDVTMPAATGREAAFGGGAGSRSGACSRLSAWAPSGQSGLENWAKTSRVRRWFGRGTQLLPGAIAPELEKLTLLPPTATPWCSLK